MGGQRGRIFGGRTEGLDLALLGAALLSGLALLAGPASAQTTTTGPAQALAAPKAKPPAPKARKPADDAAATEAPTVAAEGEVAAPVAA